MRIQYKASLNSASHSRSIILQAILKISKISILKQVLMYILLNFNFLYL